jgi:hypothetical protein
MFHVQHQRTAFEDSVFHVQHVLLLACVKPARAGKRRIGEFLPSEYPGQSPIRPLANDAPEVARRR